MLKKNIYLALMLGCFCFAETSGSFSFLSAGTGARALALGGAFTALADDTSALYWNPAGLVKLDIYKTHFTGMFSNMEHGRLLGYAGIYEKMENGAGSAGISLHYFRVSGIDGRNASGFPTGDIEYNAGVLSVSYANILPAGVQAGLSLKYYYASAQDITGKGFGADLGMICKPFGPYFSAGLTIKDINTGIIWSGGRTDYVKTLFVFGAAQSIIHEKISVSVDIESDTVLTFRYRLGSEYMVNENFALRLGINNGDLTAGFGVAYQNYIIDYAFAMDNDGFADVHRFSFSAGF
ncbi:MAG: PorV/PorQ family protein [Candidatus Firestonebacteria bacterium]|nr:PorV/PorQ family protein [Candidatus Firestonebacteria bacterium]